MSCDAALGPADAVAVPAVAVGWSFQEWAIHKYLLHGFEVTIASECPSDWGCVYAFLRAGCLLMCMLLLRRKHFRKNYIHA